MAARGRNLQFGLLGLLAIVILGGLSAYAARDNIIRYTLNPNRNFGEGAQATAPNYALRSAWAAQPSVAAKSVDVFFIYPTVYFSSEYWNAPIKNASVRERLTRIIRPLYVAPFSSAANLYMPLYRQAAPYSFMGSSEDGRSARELAFDDVSKAFRLFLDQLNAGRPFIVAGYGQGALYGFRLISELDPSERNRMLAGYLLEIAIPVELTRSMAKATPLCDSPDQIGCIVVWHSTTQHTRGDLPRQNARVWRPGGGWDATRGRELACVNPLTWTVSGRAGTPDMNLGAATLPDFGTRSTTITRALTSADCWNGLLFTDIAPDPIFLWAGPRYQELFPSNVNPFYADISDNVERRIKSFLAQGSLSEPPADEGSTPNGDLTAP